MGTKMKTVIDGISIQVTAVYDDISQIRDDVDDIIKKEYNFYSKEKTNQRYTYYDYYYSGNRILTRVDNTTRTEENDYTTINNLIYTVMGLSQYDSVRDKISNDILEMLFMYFNQKRINYKINGVDIALDLPHSFDNILIIRTSDKTKSNLNPLHQLTKYEKEEYIIKGRSRYIERFDNKRSLRYTMLKYEKHIKNNLGFILTRCEISFSNQLFTSISKNIDADVVEELEKKTNNYHILYVSQKQKRKIVKLFKENDYSYNERLRRRLKKNNLELEQFRIQYNFSMIEEKLKEYLIMDYSNKLKKKQIRKIQEQCRIDILKVKKEVKSLALQKKHRSEYNNAVDYVKGYEEDTLNPAMKNIERYKKCIKRIRKFEHENSKSESFDAFL